MAGNSGNPIERQSGKKAAIRMVKYGITVQDISYLTGINELKISESLTLDTPPARQIGLILTMLANFGNAPRRKKFIESIKDRPSEYQTEWRPIPTAEEYEVSFEGKVRRVTNGQKNGPGYILRPRVTHTGHHHVSVYRNGKQWRESVHRLVALAFIGPPPFPGAIVLHSDGNAANNTPANLRWGTYKQNGEDASKHYHERKAAARAKRVESVRSRKKAKQVIEMIESVV